jgi:NADPH:quinone reductase
MRALLSVAPGGPESLVIGEIDLPTEVPAGHVRVAIHACAVNYPDVLLIADRYQRRPPRPFAPGIDIAGIVEAVGAGISDLRVGDRVMAQLEQGGMAEFADVSANRCARLPASLAFDQAAAMLTTYGTARYALEECGALLEGSTLLVLGAAGGVGLAAVEVGCALGARVVAATSSERKLAIARQHGADAGVIYSTGAFDKSSSKAFGDQVRVACAPAKGPNVILDVVGGDYAEAAFRTIARRGRYLVVGFAGGIPRLPLNLALLSSASIVGVAWSADLAAEPDWLRDQLTAVLKLYEAGKIHPLVSERFPLEKGGDAIACLADRRAVGKLVVQVR